MYELRALNLTNGAGAYVDIDVRRGSIWIILLFRKLLQHFCERLEVEGFDQVGIEAGGADARDVVAATKTGDGYYRNMLTSIDLSQAL